MPFTPVHMGPGLFIKGLMQSCFSLMIFGWAQIIMDLQPLFVMLSGEGELHGFSHTYVGAALLAVLSAVSGKYIGESGLRLLDRNRYQTVSIHWMIAVTSAFIGTFSHVAIDSIMHADMNPYYPFSTDNQLLGLVSSGLLYKLCLYAGLIGAGIVVAMDRRVR